MKSIFLKVLFASWLLIPSLSWGEAIYKKWNCNQLNSSNTNCSQSISLDDFSVKKFFKGKVKSGEPTEGETSYEETTSTEKGKFRLESNNRLRLVDGVINWEQGDIWHYKNEKIFKITLPNKNTFEGTFDKENGGFLEGTYTFYDTGDRFVGTFYSDRDVDAQKDGKYYFADGRTGTYRNGVFSEDKNKSKKIIKKVANSGFGQGVINVFFYLAVYFGGWILLFGIIGSLMGLGKSAEFTEKFIKVKIFKNLILTFIGYLGFLALFGTGFFLFFGKFGLIIIHFIAMIFILGGIFHGIFVKLIENKSISNLMDKSGLATFLISAPIIILPLYLSYEITMTVVEYFKPQLQQFLGI